MLLFFLEYLLSVVMEAVWLRVEFNGPGYLVEQVDLTAISGEKFYEHSVRKANLSCSHGFYLPYLASSDLRRPESEAL